MRQIVLSTLYLLIASLFSQLSFAGESLKADHIKISWLIPNSFSENTETLIGIRFQMDEHWHVYWKNPGDSGAAPKFRIVAKNASVSEVLWPYPSRLPIAHLTNLGYDDETVYFFKIKPNSSSPIELEANLEWLVCKDECVPGFGQVNFSRPVKGNSSNFTSESLLILKKFEKRIPSQGLNSPYRIEVSDTPAELTAKVSSQTILPEKIDLFPVDPDYLQPSQPKISRNQVTYEVTFKKSSTAQKPDRFAFVLTADSQPYDFSDIRLSVASNNSKESLSLAVLLVLLGSALLGGIFLNLMPCVFPVISIKAISLLKNDNPKARARDGILYTLGVLTTFAGLGAGFLILRNLGSSVGWGFQLQSPSVVLSLILLFWLMALNFLGVFEFGTSVMNSSASIRWQSSFGTGILSVFIAAPCTGPFMGTALGATATMPGYQAMIVFLALGLGLALPYLLLTLSHPLARRMPKPGAWMETLKQFFAFPLFATVLWLLWVLGQQTGSQGWLVSGIALLGVSFAIWLGQSKKKFWVLLAWLTAIITIVYSVHKVRTFDAEGSQSSFSNDWQIYTEQKLTTALKNGQPVFVDFTAAWCITCQVNKKNVLETADADIAFRTKNILRLKADWTKQDPLITQALSRLRRNSVPVYAFYSGKDLESHELLPQILTIEMIENLIPYKEE